MFILQAIAPAGAKPTAAAGGGAAFPAIGFPSRGTSLAVAVLFHVAFTLSGFVCFPWAPFGKPLASAYY